MKVWIVHQHAIPPVVMGPTRHFDLAQQLIKQGHEVIILAGNYCHYNFFYLAESYKVTQKLSYYNNVPFFWFDVPSYRTNSIKRLYNMLVFAVKLLISKELNRLPKPDLIVGSTPSPLAAYAAQKLAERFDVPFIYEIRDLWPQTLMNLGNFPVTHPLVFTFKQIEKKLLNKAAKIISVLPGINDYLNTTYLSNLSTLWLPNSVAISKIPVVPIAQKERIKVFYTGSFNLSNDVETLLYAAKIVQTNSNGGFEFHLFGEGPEKEKLQKIIQSEKLTEVKICPAVNKAAIFRQLASADICVAMLKKAELYQWGSSLNKIADYFASARPVIFAIDSPYDPVSEAQAGLTITPQNPKEMAAAILQIGALPLAERIKLGLNGRRYAEANYNLDTMANRFLEYVS